MGLHWIGEFGLVDYHLRLVGGGFEGVVSQSYAIIFCKIAELLPKWVILWRGRWIDSCGSKGAGSVR